MSLSVNASGDKSEKVNLTGPDRVENGMNLTLIHLIGAVTLSVMLPMGKGCLPAMPSEPNRVPVAKESTMEPEKETPDSQMPRTERQWKKKLTPEEYTILREKGTERPFTGEYDKFFKPGVYQCAGCGAELFISDAKYNSGCGWPAFSAPADESVVKESRDTSLGRVRTEITCSQCGGHLGHVFSNEPSPTGLRYCINSAALDFEEKKDPQ